MRAFQWFFLGMATFALLSALVNHAARAAPNPTIEQPTSRLQKPAKSKSTCILKMTTQRFLVSPDGRMEYAGGFTVWTACDR